MPRCSSASTCSKAVRLCLETASAPAPPFPFAALTREILTAAPGRGHADDDFAALIEVLEGEGGHPPLRAWEETVSIHRVSSHAPTQPDVRPPGREARRNRPQGCRAQRGPKTGTKSPPGTRKLAGRFGDFGNLPYNLGFLLLPLHRARCARQDCLQISSPPTSYMPIAFKEWAVTVRALAEGEQLLTLRKGGIREPGKHFKLDYDRFFLYPTFDHQRSDLVRESHQPELVRALEEGVWSDGEPPPHTLHHEGAIVQPDRVRIRAWAEVAAHYTITDRRTVDALSPFYVWTTDYAEKRLAWKRRHPLHVILLRTYRIPRPVTVKVRDEYGGCRSWLELTRELPFEGTPVLSDEEFERASEEIAAIAADRQPVMV